MNNVIALEARQTAEARQTTTGNSLYFPRAQYSDLYGRTATKIMDNESLESAMHRAGVLFDAEKTFETWQHDGRIVTGDEYILKRSDTGAKLGNVTSRYKPVQPSEIVEGWQKIVGAE